MFDGNEEPREEFREGRTDQPEEAHPAAGEDVGAPEEGAGSAKEGATPKIGEDAEKGQTAHPAPDDDVGVPEDPDAPSDEGSETEE